MSIGLFSSLFHIDLVLSPKSNQTGSDIGFRRGM
jgi:hypothetical protein